MFKNNESVEKEKRKETKPDTSKTQNSKLSNQNLEKLTKSLSSSPTPATKPPIPAPRAINNQEKSKDVGKCPVLQ